jgi:hypothetical protein
LRIYSELETVESVSAALRVARSTVLAICAVLVIVVGVLGVSVFRLQRQVAALDHQTTDARDAMLKEGSKVRDLAAIIGNSNRNTLKAIREELDHATHDAQVSAGQAKLEALMNVERLARELRTAEQREQDLHLQVNRQMSDAHAESARAQAKIIDVSTEVTSVKGQVTQTQSNLNRAVSDLKRVMGDMGVMSGLVATNEHDLEYLKALGDRNYTQFRLTKSKEPSMVAGIGLVLRHTDAHAQKYTLDVIASDVRVQKKDKTVDEPVQFYVADSRQPYEIVVNSVGRNIVEGYLSTPKLTLARK